MKSFADSGESSLLSPEHTASQTQCVSFKFYMIDRFSSTNGLSVNKYVSGVRTLLWVTRSMWFNQTAYEGHVTIPSGQYRLEFVREGIVHASVSEVTVDNGACTPPGKGSNTHQYVINK